MIYITKEQRNYLEAQGVAISDAFERDDFWELLDIIDDAVVSNLQANNGELDEIGCRLENIHDMVYATNWRDYVDDDEDKRQRPIQLYDHVRIKATGVTGIVIDIDDRRRFFVQSDEKGIPGGWEEDKDTWSMFTCERRELERIDAETSVGTEKTMRRERMQNMLNMTEKTEAFLIENLPEALHLNDIGVVLTMLYSLIDEKGFAPPHYESYNDFGEEAQKAYDDLYYSN